ncbi:hypothetical protein Tco_1044411 [Tanacetum coccineum]|uniref:Uncharacterized protein n=1 Tax=Tanacetum coccineum TaxID=301880 RepID=A0ABQ5GPU5_9ASTR
MSRQCVCALGRNVMKNRIYSSQVRWMARIKFVMLLIWESLHSSFHGDCNFDGTDYYFDFRKSHRDCFTKRHFRDIVEVVYYVEVWSFYLGRRTLVSDSSGLDIALSVSLIVRVCADWSHFSISHDIGDYRRCLHSVLMGVGFRPSQLTRLWLPKSIASSNIALWLLLRGAPAKCIELYSGIGLFSRWGAASTSFA